MSERKYQTVSVAVPNTLLKEMDVAIENGHYVSRSDLLRSAIKKLVEKNDR